MSHPSTYLVQWLKVATNGNVSVSGWSSNYDKALGLHCKVCGQSMMAEIRSNLVDWSVQEWVKGHKHSEGKFAGAEQFSEEQVSAAQADYKQLAKYQSMLTKLEEQKNTLTVVNGLPTVTTTWQGKTSGGLTGNGWGSTVNIPAAGGQYYDAPNWWGGPTDNIQPGPFKVVPFKQLPLTPEQYDEIYRQKQIEELQKNIDALKKALNEATKDQPQVQKPLPEPKGRRFR